MEETESKPRGDTQELGQKRKVANKEPKILSRREEKGVIYIGHLPWGFEEAGLKDYFSQFGEIVKIRLARSRKTGKSKGYAFLKFAHDEVAKIAAETMDNYLMFGKLVKCKQIKEVHPKTFVGRKGPFTPKITTNAITQHNKPKTEARLTENKRTAMKKYMKKITMLKKHGIDYKLENMEKMKDTLSKPEDLPQTPQQIVDQSSTPGSKTPAGQNDKMPDIEMKEKLPSGKKVKTPAVQSNEGTPTGKNAKTPKLQLDAETPQTSLKTPSGKKLKTQTPQQSKETPQNKKSKEGIVSKTPKSTGKAGLRNETPKALKGVNTPMEVESEVVEASSDDEISFKTPPQSINPSPSVGSGKQSTPRSQKRKLRSASTAMDSKKLLKVEGIDVNVEKTPSGTKSNKKTKPESGVSTPKKVKIAEEKTAPKSISKSATKSFEDDAIGTPISHRMRLRTPRKETPKSLKQTPASAKRKKTKSSVSPE